MAIGSSAVGILDVPSRITMRGSDCFADKKSKSSLLSPRDTSRYAPTSGEWDGICVPKECPVSLGDCGFVVTAEEGEEESGFLSKGPT